MRQVQIKAGAGALCLVILFLLASAGLAQGSINHDLSWFTIAGGSGQMESANHILLGTAGQTLTGSGSGSSYALGSGFWSPGWQPGPTPPVHRLYLPLVNRTQP